eukprot:CAMPEP_0194291918 /NCGR_PEP_ID=MMETSP0169-20130528/44488_1 /TAXON_ID=218684 /ORGANISM="Corethron pennatum, Strain L29A3" /LENGTH=275 /DNA_ID=CAMNT_0039039943 /DNA_START=129 /DNA_END=952 /DNA_ORIENTATION=+
MQKIRTISFFYLTLTSSVYFSFGLQASHEHKKSARVNVSRREIISGMLASAAIAKSSSVLAKDDIGTIDIYFGCGCFWHVQHEMIEAERRILNRGDESLTARVGYAGGYRTPKQNPKSICYPSAYTPNPLHGDYRKLGYAEVVSLSIPPSKLSDFVTEYIDLFDRYGNRPDQVQDVGPPYRNLIGLPGGSDLNSSYYKQVSKVLSSNRNKNIEFRDGKGYDDDVKGVSFVMDTTDFPFVVGERYHQFHDGFFKNEDYPDSYNKIAQVLKQNGKLG